MPVSNIFVYLGADTALLDIATRHSRDADFVVSGGENEDERADPDGGVMTQADSTELLTDMGIIRTYTAPKNLIVWALVIPKVLTPKFKSFGENSFVIEYTVKPMIDEAIDTAEIVKSVISFPLTSKEFEIPSPRRLTQDRKTIRVKKSPPVGDENGPFYAVLIIPFETEEDTNLEIDLDPDAPREQRV